MAIKYCIPEIPSVYWIKRVSYSCKQCGLQFESLRPNGDSIIKFVEENGGEIRWLPTYGNGGYLDLMSKLIPGFNTNNEITMKIAKEFDAILKRYTQPSALGKAFTSLGNSKELCPKCGDKQLLTLGEVGLTSPDIEWMKVSCDLL